jgi:hypothetical protein
MNWNYLLISIVFGSGTILGFGFTMLAEHIKRGWSQRDRLERANQFLTLIIEEIQNGIERCKFIKQLRDGSEEKMIKEIQQNEEQLTEKEMEKEIKKGIKVSPSRIYVSFWNSIMIELSQCIKNTEIVGLLHSIYSRFDLVNFNMERNDFLMGANFADTHIPKIEHNLSELKKHFPLQSPPTFLEKLKSLRKSVFLKKKKNRVKSKTPG